MNNTYSKVKNFIAENSLIENKNRILLSMSAGKDSIIMFHILKLLKKDFNFETGIFHLNHLMRGKESDLDESFLQDLARRENTEIFIEKYDFRKNINTEESFEEHARNIRYQYLERISKDNNFNKIATAHNIDDNIETLLMRIFSGSGIFGLRGIDISRENIIRPLLCLSVKEIYDYLNNNKIAWREDSSNKENKYLRNYVRNDIIPMITRRFPGALNSINSLSLHANENISLIDNFISNLYENIIENSGDSIQIDYSDFINDYPLFKFIISKTLRENFKHNVNQGMLAEIYKNVQVNTSNILLYQNRALKIEKIYINNQSRIKISHQRNNDKCQLEWEYKIDVNDITESIIEIKEIDASITIKRVKYNFFVENKLNNMYIFIALSEKIDHICIRNRRDGDRIKLESGSKKIKDLLIEKKLDNESKNCVPFLCINSNIVAFMPGLVMNMKNRTSIDFWVDENSKKIFVIFSNNSIMNHS